MDPASSPPAPHDPAAPWAATGRRFGLVVFPASGQQRWHAVLLPEGSSPVDALEFGTPLELARHLAQLAPAAPAPSGAASERSRSGGLR